MRKDLSNLALAAALVVPKGRCARRANAGSLQMGRTIYAGTEALCDTESRPADALGRVLRGEFGGLGAGERPEGDRDGAVGASERVRSSDPCVCTVQSEARGMDALYPGRRTRTRAVGAASPRVWFERQGVSSRSDPKSFLRP